MKVFTSKNVTLYHGDAIDILPTLPLVDCVVMDAPYKLVSGGNKTGQMGGKFAKGVYDNSGSIVECDITWNDFMSLVSDRVERGHIYSMCNNRHVEDMLRAAREAGMKFHNLLVWNKRSPTPNRWYMKHVEFTGLFYKGKAFYLNNCGSKQYYDNETAFMETMPNPKKTKHPTEKPIDLMRHYIDNSTKVGEVVLDPFCGSGSTGIAAIEARRKFIGIEKNKDFFDMAVERIKNTEIGREIVNDDFGDDQVSLFDV